MAHCQIEDLSSISILVAGATKHLFTFGWDDSGKCRWKRGVDYLHPWQVLKTALEPFFFDERYRFLLVG